MKNRRTLISGALAMIASLRTLTLGRTAPDRSFMTPPERLHAYHIGDVAHITSFAPGHVVEKVVEHVGEGTTIVDGRSYRWSFIGGWDAERKAGWKEYAFESPDCHGNLFVSLISHTDDFPGHHVWSIGSSPDYTARWEESMGRSWAEAKQQKEQA